MAPSSLKRLEKWRITHHHVSVPRSQFRFISPCPLEEGYMNDHQLHYIMVIDQISPYDQRRLKQRTR